MPEIIVKAADQTIERIVTEKDHLSIGRTPDNDVVLDSAAVSRKHARIEFSPRGAELQDLDSLNGTFVNRLRVTRRFLTDCDVITIGRYELVFYSDTQAGARTIQPVNSINSGINFHSAAASGKHNPLASLMETRPIPISHSGGARPERKEHR